MKCFKLQTGKLIKHTHQWFSTCGPWISSVAPLGSLLEMEIPRASPQTCWTKNGVRPCNVFPRWFQCPLKAENHCYRSLGLSWASTICLQLCRMLGDTGEHKTPALGHLTAWLGCQIHIRSSVGNWLQYLGRTWPLHTCPVIWKKGLASLLPHPSNGMAFDFPYESHFFRFHSRHQTHSRNGMTQRQGGKCLPFPWDSNVPPPHTAIQREPLFSPFLHWDH